VPVLFFILTPQGGSECASNLRRMGVRREVQRAHNALVANRLAVMRDEIVDFLGN
jgi:hypothetical protein